MKNSAAQVVRQLLQDVGLGTDPQLGSDWAVYYAKQGNVSDRVITVYDTASVDHGRNMVTGARFQHFGVAVRVRADTPEEAQGRAGLLADAMNQQVLNNRVTVVSKDGTSADYLVQSFSSTTIGYQGQEANSRMSLVTINATVTVRQL